MHVVRHKLQVIHTFQGTGDIRVQPACAFEIQDSLIMQAWEFIFSSSDLYQPL